MDTTNLSFILVHYIVVYANPVLIYDLFDYYICRSKGQDFFLRLPVPKNNQSTISLVCLKRKGSLTFWRFR